MNENAGAPKKAARLTGALLARKGMATPAGFVRVATESPRPTTAIPEAAAGEGGESRAAPVLAVDGGQATLALGDEGELETGPTEAKNTAADGDWASLSDISIGPRFREAAAQAAAARSGSAVAEQSGKGDSGGTLASPHGADTGATDGRAAAPLAANDRGKQAAARAAAEGARAGPKTGQRAEPVLTGAAAKTTPPSPPPIPAREGRPAGGGMRPAEGWAPARRVSPELADPRPRRAAPAMSTRPRKPRRRRRVLPGFVSVLALAVFLLVSWTVYQIGQGDPGADAQDSSSTGLRASAEELGFAVSQMFAAITGRLDETPAPETGGDAESASQGFVAESDAVIAPAGAELAGSGLDEAVPDEVVPNEVGQDTGPAAVEPEDAGLAALAGDSVADIEIASGEAGGAAAGVDDAGNADSGGSAVAGDAADAGVAVAPAIQAAAGSQGADRPEDPQLLTPGDVAQGLPSAADVEPAADGAAEVAVAPASGPTGEEAPGPALAGADAEVIDAVPAEAENAAGTQTPQSLVRVPVPKPDVLARAGSANGGAAADAGAAPAEVAAAVDASVPGYAVQLSSLRDEAAARREWARLSEELADVLGTTELTVEAGTVSARGTFFRVLTTRFAQQSDARAICESIQGRGQDCLVVRQR